jgi:Protein of unknown function (DUF642)/PEP-CTERM motif
MQGSMPLTQTALTRRIHGIATQPLTATMTSFKLSSTRAALVAALIVSSGASQANLLTNGSFEMGSAATSGFSTLAAGNTTMTGWTVVGDNLAWFHNDFVDGATTLTASNGVKFLDLTNTSPNCNPCGGVEQTIATAVGQNYTLSFDLGSSTTYLTPSAIEATIQIVVGGIVTQTFTSTASGVNNWETFSKTFTASNANTTIRLQGSFAQLDYVGLDNVSVVATPVPEPGTWAMMAAGLAAMGSVASRRRAQR